jgi:hypothetical protein
MDEEKNLKCPRFSWTVKAAVVLIFVASIYCAENPDSSLARFLRSFRR